MDEKRLLRPYGDTTGDGRKSSCRLPAAFIT
jgi:hypothetical protein